MNVRLHALLAWAVLGLLYLPSAAAGADCTDGVDCYCDRQNTSNTLVCEDFEAPTLHGDTGPGDHTNAGGENVHGPWYDEGSTDYRGANNYWTETYGSVTNGCAWRSGQPSNPEVGISCSAGTCFAAEWRADDKWDANSFACVDVIQDGEFDDEVSSIADPIVPSASGESHRGVFDGKQVLGRRIAPGKTNAMGSRARFGGAYKTVGMTMALAYPTNSEQVNVWGSPWKHNEWATPTGFDDGPIVFHNGGSLAEDDPFQQFMWYASGRGEGDCESALAGANVRLGNVSCHSVAMYYRADPSAYRRSEDFPFGTWGCVQGYLKDLGSSDTEIKIWFNGKLIVDIDELDGSFLASKDGYTNLYWNSYANKNAASLGDSPTTETTYRYEDNIHVTNGPPVSCDQIGFSGFPDNIPAPDPNPDPDPDPQPDPDPDPDPDPQPDPDPDPDPQPIPNPGSGGALNLGIGVAVNGSDATITANVSGGVGAYKYHFDCDEDGGWDQIIDSGSPSASASCPAPGSTAYDVTVFVWDRGSGATEQGSATVSPSGGGGSPPASPPEDPLGQPGKPVLIPN